MEVNDIFPDGLSVDAALELLEPLAVYVAGMAIYAIFIFKFYRFVASRDMFELDFSKYEASRFKFVRTVLHFFFYVLRYLILFPVFAFFWFAVLTVILAFLSRDQAFTQVLLVALATVGTIRIASYYEEDLSRDLAKILPFAVLGIFLINASFFEVSESLDILKQADDHRETILYYLIALIALEFALRIAMAAITIFCAVRDRIRMGPAPDEEDEPFSPAEEPEVEGPSAQEPEAEEYAPQEEAPQYDDPTASEAAEEPVGEGAPNRDA